MENVGGGGVDQNLSRFLERLESADDKQLQGLRIDADYIASAISHLPDAERAAQVNFIQKELRAVHDAGGSPGKVELLRVLLYGTKLDSDPSQQRFHFLMDLANQFADRLTQVPEVYAHPENLTVDGEDYAVYVLPDRYLFIGCADSPDNVTKFSEQLRKADYHETLCVSAVNEDSGYFQESKKILLVMHVDADAVVHTQEQDLRSPRFSENQGDARVLWYDSARRVVGVAAQIDTLHRGMSSYGQLHGLPGSTDMDRYNRLTLALDSYTGGLSKYVRGRVEDFDPSASSADVDSMFELLERGRLTRACLELLEVSSGELESAAEATGVVAIGMGVDPRDTRAVAQQTLDCVCTKPEQGLLLEYLSVLKLHDQIGVLAEPFEERRSLLYVQHSLRKLDRALEAVRGSPTPRELNEAVKQIRAFGAVLKRHSELDPGARSALKDLSAVVTLMMLERIKEVKYHDVYLHASEDETPKKETIWDYGAFMNTDRDFFSDDYKDKVQSLKEMFEEQGLSTSQFAEYDEQVTHILRELRDRQAPTVQELLEAARETKLDEAHQQALDAYESRSRILDEGVPLPDKDRGHLAELIKERAAVSRRLNDIRLRTMTLEGLEKIPEGERLKEHEDARAVLQRERSPLEETEAEKLAEKLEEQGIVDGWDDEQAVGRLLMGQDTGQPITAEDLKKSRHYLSRPKLQLAELKALQGPSNLLNRLETRLAEIPHSFEGYNADHKVKHTFTAWPERLRGPQELLSQTGAALSGSRYDWNEINLDLEATGGGPEAGVYPTGLVVSRELIEAHETVGTLDATLGPVLAYAREKGLPVFVKQ